MNMSKAWQLLRQTVSEYLEDKAPQLGASLAFYSALSIAPMLVIALAIAGLFFDQEAARGQITGELRTMVGDDGGQAIEDMIESADQPDVGSVAAIFGIITLLFGASGVFGQLQDALNTIWEVKPKPGRGVWGFIRDRFLSFAMVLGVAFLLLVSLLLSAALSAVSTWTDQLPTNVEWLAPIGHFLVSFLVITVLFALIFKLLPDVKMAWSDVWVGAIVTAGLFSIGKFAIGLYLGQSSMASSYGVAGSFVVFLLWVYYSAQILFFGAEITQVYANHYGSQIEPADHAEPLTEEERAQQGRPHK